MPDPAPFTVRDKASWTDLRELDDYGENLTQWEVDFVESLTKQLLAGRSLTEAQRNRLDSIIEDRL